MSQNQEPPAEGIQDGDPIRMDALAGALTRSPLAYSDGTAQVFLPDGSTTFTERDGRRTSGEWGVDEGGRFWSFWPPSYRAEYDVSWAVESNHVVGVRFQERARGATSDGRYVDGG